MKKVLLTLLFAIPLWAFAQSDTAVAEQLPPIKVFTYVEQMPEFKGGQDSMNLFITKNIRYPEKALKENLQGKVYATFVVREDGKISDIKIQRGIGSGCDEEVIRILKLMPAWVPGKQSGRAVNVQYTLPIIFSLK